MSARGVVEPRVGSRLMRKLVERFLIRPIGVPASARPEIAPEARGLSVGAGLRLLVLGVYLGARPNLARSIVREIARCRSHDVHQHWIALERVSNDRRVRGVTRVLRDALEPKFGLLNGVLADLEPDRYDYVLVVDDDVVLPEGFLAALIGVQERLDLAIAQPARTWDSFVDLPIVQQAPGLLGRRTLFVEQGPVISFRRDAFEYVLPFDETSTMGWGIENVWSLEASRRGQRMGIVDAVPVVHSLRRPVTYYSWEDADRGRTRLFESRDHRPTEECFRVVEAVALDEADR